MAKRRVVASVPAAAPAPQPPVETPAPPAEEVRTSLLDASPAPVPEPAMEEGLPLPEGEAASVSVATGSHVVVTPVESPPPPVAVVEAEPVMAPPAPRAPLGEAFVQLRAVKTLDTPPVIGRFDFHEAVGRDPRTGQTLRGQFRDGFHYRVPGYVASACIERNWGILAS